MQQSNSINIPAAYQNQIQKHKGHIENRVHAQLNTAALQYGLPGTEVCELSAVWLVPASMHAKCGDVEGDVRTRAEMMEN